MNRLPETVTTKFTVLFEALQDAADDLKIAGAEANLLGDFSQVNALNESCRRIQLLENEIQASLNNFTSKRNNNKTGLRKNRRYRTRKSGGRIRVMVMEKVIEEATIAETFLNALQVIGLEKVAKLHKIVSGAPLVARTQANGYQAQRQCKGWYVTTHVNKKTAATMLSEIGRELNIPVSVESIEH